MERKGQPSRTNVNQHTADRCCNELEQNPGGPLETVGGGQGSVRHQARDDRIRQRREGAVPIASSRLTASAVGKLGNATRSAAAVARARSRPTISCIGGSRSTIDCARMPPAINPNPSTQTGGATGPTACVVPNTNTSGAAK